jgi:hypothetical protein
VLISSVQGLDTLFFSTSHEIATTPSHIPSGTYFIADVQDSLEDFRESTRFEKLSSEYSSGVDNFLFDHGSLSVEIKSIQFAQFEQRILTRKLPEKLFLGHRSLLI